MLSRKPQRFRNTPLWHRVHGGDLRSGTGTEQQHNFSLGALRNAYGTSFIGITCSQPLSPTPSQTPSNSSGSSNQQQSYGAGTVATSTDPSYQWRKGAELQGWGLVLVILAAIAVCTLIGAFIGASLWKRKHSRAGGFTRFEDGLGSTGNGTRTGIQLGRA
ncbi:g7573 [Coccomyxa elongata]